MKAIWNGQVIAESDDTIIIENNHYFPREHLSMEFFVSSDKTTHCPWKGDASYYSLVVDGETNTDAAWYYPQPKAAAKEIENRVAFWRGVKMIA